jgi:hypothetical protein
MKPIIAVALLVAAGTTVRGDSGGPYEFVPDISSGERPPICQIPATLQPLEFYLKHFPELIWDKRIAEPTTFVWKEIGDRYAAPIDCGHIPYNRVVAIRYISQERINQGLLHADAILILGAQSSDNNYQPIYFTVGGPSVYNHRVEISDGNQPEIRVFRDLSGTGAFAEQVEIWINNDGLYKVKRK